MRGSIESGWLVTVMYRGELIGTLNRNATLLVRVATSHTFPNLPAADRAAARFKADKRDRYGSAVAALYTFKMLEVYDIVESLGGGES